MTTCPFEPLLPDLVLPTEAAPDVLAHVDGCEGCARALADLRETFAALALTLPAAEPPPDLRESLLAGVSGEKTFGGFARRVARLFDLSVAAARGVLDTLADPARWEGVPGVELFHVDGGPATAGADAGFVRFAPGLPYPRHEHHGDEVMLLVSGSLRDDGGHLSLAGDVLLHGPGTSHSFVIGEGEPCVVALLLRGGPPTILPL